MRARQAEQTRNRLFDAAYALLEKNHFEDITIKDIVQQAGVSTGTFYLYFKSKLDVYYQTYTLADAYFVDVVAPMLTLPDARGNLLLFFEQYAYYNTDHTSLRLTKLLYNADNKCFVRSSGPGMLSVLQEVVERGLAAGELDTELDAPRVVQFLMDAVRGLVYNWCIRDGDFDLKDAMESYVALLYRAIRRAS